jgi:uncharacterized protein YraI
MKNMKRLAILLLLCCSAAVAFAQTKGGTLYVAVKSAAVKSSTWFFASTKGTLTYGTQITVQSVNGKWVEIKSGSLTGWVENASLTSKKITSSASSTSASVTEIALAGKGFNEEIEGTYKAGNAELDYANVDLVEKIAVSPDELQKFIKDGKLIGAEGDK